MSRTDKKLFPSTYKDGYVLLGYDVDGEVCEVERSFDFNFIKNEYDNMLAEYVKDSEECMEPILVKVVEGRF